MKTVFKILGGFIFLLIIVAGAFLIYFNSTYPKVSAASNVTIERTPQRLERGYYLTHHITGCLDCHSQRDFSKYSGPIVRGTEGMGGEKFDNEIANIPGVVYARNITPAGIGDWTDGEVLRAITVGVNKKGEALFPLMPYKHYRNLCQEDLYSIIAYIRTLKPIENKVPERSLNFPVNFLVKADPSDVDISTNVVPDKNNTLAYGKYMANAATCIECHTKLDKGNINPGTEFAGGFQFCFNGMCVTSANITSDQQTGIGTLSKEEFIKKFTFYRDSTSQAIPVGLGGNNTIMPWIFFGTMNDEDLGAIYTYIKSMPPISNKIEKWARKQ